MSLHVNNWALLFPIYSEFQFLKSEVLKPYKWVDFLLSDFQPQVDRVYTSINIKFTRVWVHKYPLAHTHMYINIYFLFSNLFITLLLVTFLYKKEQKSATNHGCTLDPLKSKMGFGSSFMSKTTKITPPIFLWNHILPFHR